MRIVVGHHDQCFDGVASAALFTRLIRELEGGEHEYLYRGLAHGATPPDPDAIFLGELNAVVDYRYFADDRLHWWFDHHRTAFGGEADEIHYRNDVSGRKFFDPEEKSCARLIADVGRERFGIDWCRQQSLIDAAHIIDGALYDTAEAAAEMKSPESRLRMVIEASGDRELLMTILRAWVDEPMEQALRIPQIAAAADGLADRERRARERVRAAGRPSAVRDDIVVIDLLGQSVEGYSKLFTYAAFPQATWTLTLLSGRDRTKIGVGFNPWCGRERTRDVSEICRRHGGGGHPVVGAISLPPGELEAARHLAVDVARWLAGEID